MFTRDSTLGIFTLAITSCSKTDIDTTPNITENDISIGNSAVYDLIGSS